VDSIFVTQVLTFLWFRILDIVLKQSRILRYSFLGFSVSGFCWPPAHDDDLWPACWAAFAMRAVGLAASLILVRNPAELGFDEQLLDFKDTGINIINYRTPVSPQ